MSGFPLSGWPGEVLDTLKLSIYELIKERFITEFRIGRTVDVASAKTRLKCDDVFSIYYSDSVRNAMVVTNELIKEFVEFEKCTNPGEHCAEEATDIFSSIVYLAIWRKWK